MDGAPHEVRSANGATILPANDPGANGGGALMGTSTNPSQADFENLFGPAGRDVKQDDMRHKRHQRWHLPDVLKGTNSFLTDRIDGLISDATESPFTSTILPYQYVENPDQHLSWDVWSYDEGLASRVPYESAARVLTQTKNTHSAYIVRQGLAISMEHNFMMSERGRRDFNNQLLQLVGSIQYTNDLDVHMALITAPNYERTEVAKYAYSDTDPYVQLRKYVDMFGMCQKNPNGLDILVEDAKQVFKKWGASDPTFMLCNSKLGYQQNMTLEKTQYVTNGVDGIKRLKAGPDLKTYRDLSVIHSRHFSMEAGRQPRDLLNRRVRVAEHYKLPAMSIGRMDQCDVLLYDESRDQMVATPCSEVFTHSKLEGDEHSFEQLLEMDHDYEKINSAFWKSVMYNPTEQSTTRSDAAFETFLNKGIAELDRDEHETPYHPEFIKAFHFYFSETYGVAYNAAAVQADVGTTAQDLFEKIQQVWNPGNTASISTDVQNKDFWAMDETVYVQRMARIFGLNSKDSLNMKMWLRFLKVPRNQLDTDYALPKYSAANTWAKKVELQNARQLESSHHLFAHLQYTPTLAGFKNSDTAYFYMWKCRDHINDAQPPAPQQPKDFGDGAGDAATMRKLMFSFVLPYTGMAYSTCNNWQGMLIAGLGIAEKKKYSLLMVRPAIEHYMLGVVIGRGGTGELGATLWGQTELSCYDDAMHGKWGMNYKYHARAVVLNEKHLLRLWDVSFNGYTGGMGTTFVNWVDTADWKTKTLALDEPIKSDFPDIFAMRFDEDKKYDQDVSNPINFAYNPEEDAQASVATDPENIHTTFSPNMNVYLKFGEANMARYKQYYSKMPPYVDMHAARKDAGFASHEGDTHSNSLSYAGTMRVQQRNTTNVLVEHAGTGHLGDSFTGSASIRAGNGMMAAGGRPGMQRLV